MTGDVNEVIPRSYGLRILGDFLKKVVSWDSDLGEASWFSSLGEARSLGSMRCTAPGGVRRNSQHSVSIVSLSPHIENLKVKRVIKVSYLNYQESSVFWVFFGFLCIWTFYISICFTHPYISCIHIICIIDMLHMSMSVSEYEMRVIQ